MRDALPTQIERSNLRRTGSSGDHAVEIDGQDIDDIWREFKLTGSPALRSYLIIHYMNGHVRRIAQRMCASLPRQVDVDDLVDEAYEGLVDVIERFDLDQNVRFESFSQQRIAGAMRDYLRKLNWRPRLEQTRSKLLQGSIETFHKTHGRGPDADELRDLIKQAAVSKFRRKHGRAPVAAELRKVQELSDKTFRKILAAGRPGSMVSYNSGTWRSPLGGDGIEEGDAMAVFEDRRQPTPLTDAELRDLRNWIARGFSRRDRLILILYYYEELTMKEIGRTLGCSESRVSQRLNSILDCLRARLNRTGSVKEFHCK